MMNIDDSYTRLIIVCLIIILSYIFNRMAKRTNVPSVLLLILLGIGINAGLDFFEMSIGGFFFDILEILGIIGLIMIVLEAALDLKLTREKRPLILKSFLVAFIALFVSAFAIAYLLNYFLISDFFTSLIFAVPLSIISSAIIIPSVQGLVEKKREFLIYESAFSDILGIMFFYFLLDNADAPSAINIFWNVSSSIVITIALSVVLSYALVLLFQELDDQVKLFLLIAALTLLYSVGKIFHLSSLIIILTFGLTLSNYKLFFRGKLKKWAKEAKLNNLLKDFHVVTMESAFVVRTFFFIVFGMTLPLESLLDPAAASVSLAIVAAIYVVRFITLKIFRIKSLTPAVLIAPRGLITILLFFAIPMQFHTHEFNSGILLYVVLATSIIMMIALIARGGKGETVERLNFDDWSQLDEEIERLKMKNAKSEG